MTPTDKEMLIEYDEEIQGYYVIWKPVVAIGIGQTEEKALEELRQAAHFGIDTMVNQKLVEVVSKDGNKNGKHV